MSQNRTFLKSPDNLIVDNLSAVKYPSKFFAKLVSDAKSGVFMPERAHEERAARAAQRRRQEERVRRDAEFAEQVSESTRSIPPGGSLKAMLTSALKRKEMQRSPM
ncbi:hypothetical protein PQR46_07535 [Paraburkholderia sediminicola]|uniref:hypothetical protein n=1 Tax=Paraburkholderia TaxID=1822464 RepID=UPI0038BCAE5C